MVRHRYFLTSCLSLFFLVLFLPDHAAGQKYAYRPACLIEDIEKGVIYWCPADFLPNPEEAFKKNALSFWHGSTQALDRWGFYTFYRPSPVSGLDPTYWIEVVEKAWGAVAKEQKTVTLPEGKALFFSFLPESDDKKWSICTLLIPAHKGVYDFTAFSPRKQSARLKKFLLSFGKDVRSFHPQDRRKFTLPCGISILLSRTWSPAASPPAGQVFRASRNQGRYWINLALIPGTRGGISQLRSVLNLPQEALLDLKAIEVPAGTFSLLEDPSTSSTYHAVLPFADDTLYLKARLSNKTGEEVVTRIGQSLEFTTTKKLNRSLRAVLAEVRSKTRSPRVQLRKALAALTRFAGIPDAVKGLHPILLNGQEEAIVEATRASREMAPFGPKAEILIKALARAQSREWHLASTALLLALGHLRNPEAINTIRPYLHSSHPGLAHAAVNAMGLMPFGRGEAMDSVIKLYASLDKSTRTSATRSGSQGVNRFKLLYFPILTALRRHSDHDFPHPGGAEAARKWLKNRLK